MRLWIVGCLAASACGARGVPESPRRVETDDGRYVLALTPSPEPWLAGDDVSLAIDVLAPGEGRPVDATLDLRAVMPDMGHGLGAGGVELTDGGKGAWEADLLFPMSGWWELTLAVVGPDGRDQAVVGYDVE